MLKLSPERQRRRLDPQRFAVGSLTLNVTYLSRFQAKSSAA
jgi:hypothetical protein